MAGGLVALLDDIAALVKTTAASLDDIAAAAGKASAKAVGVVVDDAAVTPRYVDGLSPDRELPIIWKIALGSIRNKLLFILPIALLLSQFAPWALTPILMAGGTYLAFEGAEKVMEALGWIGHHGSAEAGQRDEKAVVGAAVRTDLILSAEIMVIALNEVDHEPLLQRAIILIVVALAITVLVYGVVGLIVKMDDIGLNLAQRKGKGVRALGRGLVKGMPVVMTILGNVGIIAMMWVGGHILLVGVGDLGWHAPYDAVHHLEEIVAHATGPLGGFLGWLTNTVCSAIIGFIVGAIVVGIVFAIRPLLKRGQSDAHSEHVEAHEASSEPTPASTDQQPAAADAAQSEASEATDAAAATELPEAPDAEAPPAKG